MHAEQSSSSQTPSQKKFTRKQIAEAGSTGKAPQNNQPKKKTAETKTSAPSPTQAPIPQQKKSASNSKSVITNTEKKPQKTTSRSNFYAKSPQAFISAVDDTDNTPETNTSPNRNEEICEPGPNSFRFSMAHREGKGIGYPQGYTSLDMFLMFSHIGNVYPFFDLRGHMSNDGKPAANFGFGIRYLPETVNAVFGINTFFDFKKARHSTYEQLGLGIEILGTQWSLQANGYLPIIKTSNIIDINFYEFQGHRALVHLQHEVAMTGGDVSIGRSLLHRGFFDLDAYLGGYYFQGNQGLKAPGGYLKLTSSLSRFFSVDVQGSYDTLFKAIFQGAAAFHIPLGKRVKPKAKGRSCYQETALARNLTDPVSRFEMIVTHLHEQTALGLDPRTDKPLYLVFVNNTAAVGGNGTAEAPYTTLALAQTNSAPGEMIYVYSGNGTNTGMNAGITLQNSQWLQSSYLGFELMTTAGPVQVPPQSNQIPFITSPANGVTLASSNIVNGFHIQAANYNIRGVNINSAQIDNNLLTGAAVDIALDNVTGNISITSNTSKSTIGLDIVTPLVFEADITNNTFSNTGLNNIFINPTTYSQNSINIEDNIIKNSTNGVSITLSNNAATTATISGNTFSGMTGTAALNILASDNSNINANISANAINTSTTGIYLVTDTTATATFGVLSNYIIDGAPAISLSPGVTFFSTNASTMNVCLAANTSVSATLGYFFLNNLAGSATMNIQSPNLQLSGVQAINSGTIQATGQINYTPFNPPNL